MGLPSCFGRESLEPSKHRDDFACNNDVFPHDNRFHAGVFGLKANMVAFLEEALDRGAVIDDGDYDISVCSGGLFFDDDVIAVVNADFHHGVSAYFQKERAGVSDDFCRKGDCLGDVLFGEYRKACGDVSYHRQ